MCTMDRSHAGECPSPKISAENYQGARAGILKSLLHHFQLSLSIMIYHSISISKDFPRLFAYINYVLLGKGSSDRSKHRTACPQTDAQPLKCSKTVGTSKYFVEHALCMSELSQSHQLCSRGVLESGCKRVIAQAITVQRAFPLGLTLTFGGDFRATEQNPMITENYLLTSPNVCCEICLCSFRGT